MRQALKSQREEAFSESEGDPVQEEARDTVLAQSQPRLTDSHLWALRAGTQEGRAPGSSCRLQEEESCIPLLHGLGLPFSGVCPHASLE